jgi:hypothetical protein
LVRDQLNAAPSTGFALRHQQRPRCGVLQMMGANAFVYIVKTILPHPTLIERIGMAAEVAHGSCTDLPPAKK